MKNTVLLNCYPTNYVEDRMKNTVLLNRYPANYVEEDLPEVLVEIRYVDTKASQEEAYELANKIEKFLNNQ